MEATVDEKHTCRNIDVVEVKVETHDYQIKSLFKAQKNFDSRLTSIDLSLKQVKWTFMGALGFFIVSEIGLLKALKFLS